MIGQWIGRGLAVAIVAAGLSACGGRPPKGVMEPVATPLPAGAHPVPLFVATTRARPKDPLLMFAGALQHGLLGVEPHEKALRLALLVVPAAMLAAHLMYGFVERPMIALGAGRAPRVRAAAA